MSTKTATTRAVTAALVITFGLALSGAAMNTAPAATASPIRDCARTYIAQGYTARDAVQRCSRELTAAAEREAATRRAAPSTTTCTQQHLDAGYTAAEARTECKGDEKPRGVIKPKKAPTPSTPFDNPVGKPRHWWDNLPEFMFPLLIFGALIIAVTIGAYAWLKPKEIAARRQQAAAFAAGGGYDTTAPPSESAVDYPEDYAPPPEPQYHVPHQQTPPPAYAQQAPAAEQQTPPPTTNSGSGGGSSASAFDDLI